MLGEHGVYRGVRSLGTGASKLRKRSNKIIDRTFQTGAPAGTFNISRNYTGGYVTGLLYRGLAPCPGQKPFMVNLRPALQRAGLFMIAATISNTVLFERNITAIANRAIATLRRQHSVRRKQVEEAV